MTLELREATSAGEDCELVLRSNYLLSNDCNRQHQSLRRCSCAKTVGLTIAPWPLGTGGTLYMGTGTGSQSCQLDPVVSTTSPRTGSLPCDEMHRAPATSTDSHVT
jgi:hypothetical protein